MRGKEGFNITPSGNIKLTETNKHHKPAWHLASTVKPNFKTELQLLNLQMNKISEI